MSLVNNLPNKNASLDTNLLLRLRGSGVGNTKWIDSSGNDFDATNNNAILNSGRYGQSNHSYSLNGTTAFFAIPNIGGSAKSISFWAYLSSEVTSGSSGEVILSQQSITNNYIGIGSLTAQATNETLVITSNIGGTERNTYINSAIKAGWYCIQFVWSATKNRYDIILNGKTYQVIAGTNGHAELLQSDSWFIGQNSAGSNKYSGIITDLEIWAKELSFSEIRAIVWRIPEQGILNLYVRGEEFTFNSGGWISGFFSGSGTTFTKNSDNIVINCPNANTARAAVNVAVINFTEYSQMLITYKAPQSARAVTFCITSDSDGDYRDATARQWVYQNYDSVTEPETREFDISSVTGSYYLGLICNAEKTLTIYSVTLKK